MPLEVQLIDESQAEIVTLIGEGQYTEVKGMAVTPGKLTKTLAAFANSDGGDLYIGVTEIQLAGGVKKRQWQGFTDVEAANGFLQAFDRLFPLGTDFQYEFMRCEHRQGIVLHAQVRRTQAIMRADDGTPYVRRGAANQPVAGAEALKRLEYAKGIASFENEFVNTASEMITKSPITVAFLKHVVPTAEAEAWLTKQTLLNQGRPTVAGVLLFAEEPQAALPKRCGVKIYRYKTKEAEGFRDVLAFDPLTIEGCIYEQVKATVAKTVEITENIPRMGEGGLEKIRYPQETLHEIITNAIIHRDYSVADDVHIRIFDNRIEVQSPGRLPAHVTVKQILQERFARNGAIVRLLNKFPDPPNKDVGEGLNTAFAKMKELGLKEPQIEERDNEVLVVIRHELLASPEETIMKHLETHDTIRNRDARALTGVRMDYQMKSIFSKMEEKGMIEQVPGTVTSQIAYRKPVKH